MSSASQPSPERSPVRALPIDALPHDIMREVLEAHRVSASDPSHTRRAAWGMVLARLAVDGRVGTHEGITAAQADICMAAEFENVSPVAVLEDARRRYYAVRDALGAALMIHHATR
jgi:hypothetical protein